MRNLRFWPLACAIAFAQTPVLTLNEAIAEAVANNPDLKAERINVDIAQARQITAALRPNPILTISGQSLDLLGTRFNAASPAGPNQFNAHTDFVLERGGKRQERIQFAAAEKTLTELEQREILRRLTFDVQTAYVDAQSALAAVALAESNLKSLHGIVEINESRVRSGDLAKVELDRSRIAALQYEV